MLSTLSLRSHHYSSLVTSSSLCGSFFSVALSSIQIVLSHLQTFLYSSPTHNANISCKLFALSISATTTSLSLLNFHDSTISFSHFQAHIITFAAFPTQTPGTTCLLLLSTPPSLLHHPSSFLTPFSLCCSFFSLAPSSTQLFLPFRSFSLISERCFILRQLSLPLLQTLLHSVIVFGHCAHEKLSILTTVSFCVPLHLD